ncbi:hypothetical protein GCM10010502_63330 [Kitasatospora aureofaciens]|uniref:Uncharacterized protein n=1 Tax=Kitasatospora aureofaciens TaxID=1894 RepID=A0A8H9LYF7_KITAU|nr:hypothetical protein GCM10010502_63330 [Kitasatospora aureofaciens]
MLAQLICRAGSGRAAASHAECSGTPGTASRTGDSSGPFCGAGPWTGERDPVAAFERARAIAATNTKASKPVAT